MGQIFSSSARLFVLTVLAACQYSEDGPHYLSHVGDSAPFSTNDSAESVTLSDTPPAVPGRNLLIVTLDATRWDQISPEVAPWLAKKSGEVGMTFQNHWSVSNWTRASFPSMLSGYYPEHFGANFFTADANDYNPIPDADIQSLAEILSAQGYATSWDNANDVAGSKVGLNDGEYDNYREKDKTQDDGDASFGWLHDQGERTITWLEEQHGPWYAHVHVIEPHDSHDHLDPSCEATVQQLDGVCPFDVIHGGTNEMNSAALGWSTTEVAACQVAVAAAQDCEVLRIDTDIKAFMNQMQAGGFLDNTVVLVVADHGEEHGELRKGISWWNHHKGLYAAETRVFAWIYWPESTGPQSITAATSHVDLVPTMLTMLGIDPGNFLDGQPVWTVPEDRVIQSIFVNGGFKLFAATSTDTARHLIRNGQGEYELYNFGSDPEELNDLSATESAPSDLINAIDDMLAETSSY